MTSRPTWPWAVLAAVLFCPTRAIGEEKVLFDFEDEAAVKDWSPTPLNELREAARKALLERLAKAAADSAAVPQYRPPATLPAPEPAVKMERAADNATSGTHSLRLTYSGGLLPTVGTDRIAVEDWAPYKTFRADVTASRTCVVVFRVMHEKSTRGDEWDDVISRYEKVARLEAGRNEVVELTYPQDFAARGKVVRFEISMYAPNDGESIWVDNIRLATEMPKATSPYSYLNVHFMGEVRAEAPFFPKLDQRIRVLGTDWQLASAAEIGEKLKDSWVKPERKTVDQVEAQFRRDAEALKKTHPRAVTAIFRDGEKGFDPAHPGKVYDGWRDTDLQGHDPGAFYATRLRQHPGNSDRGEFFLRRRTSLMKVDLSSIPRGSEILLARFMAVKVDSPNPEVLKTEYAWSSPLKPTFFVAEACNRDWDEQVANGIEYARGKFWKEICGEYWTGDDPDFLPLVIAYGQAGYDQNVFDFTEAVRFWADGRHPNHGFAIYSFGKYMEFCSVWHRHVANVRKRPALMVVYEPKE